MEMLVAGGTGFIGSAVVLRAIGSGYQVVNMDALTYAACLGNVASAADHPGYAIDPTWIATELGWRPSVTLEQGLEKTVQWSLDNEEWSRALQDRAGGWSGLWRKQKGEGYESKRK